MFESCEIPNPISWPRFSRNYSALAGFLLLSTTSLTIASKNCLLKSSEYLERIGWFWYFSAFVFLCATLSIELRKSVKPLSKYAD